MNVFTRLVLAGMVFSGATTGIVFAQTETPDAGAPATGGEAARAAPAVGRDSPKADAGQDSAVGQRDRATSQADFGSRRIERLRQADADGDGTLSRPEIEAMVLHQMVERRAERTARRLDINGDGSVTIAEIEAQQGKRFALLDRNEDGQLDRREMRAGHRGGPHGFDRHGGRHEMRHGHGDHRDMRR